MIQVAVSQAQMETLYYERYNNPHPRVQIKMDALYHKGKGYSNAEICDLLRISPNTLRSYFRQFNEGGVDKLKEINFHQPKSQLDSHRTTIEQLFRDSPQMSLKQAAAEIERLTGIKRSNTQIRKYLKSLGIRLLKVGSIPAKADVEVQKTFVEDKLNPRIDEARAGTRKLLFMDAAHFVLSPFLGFLWCFARVFIKAPAGRQRFNVLGAIDAISHELITVTNDTYINALSVCDILRKIRERYVDMSITIVLDNARYQKCRIVLDLAKQLDIELLYLPSYSPNLNIIERLWKFIKKKCLYSKYYETFDLFKSAISDCLNKTGTEYKTELDSLLNLKFQTFEKTQIMTF